MTSTTMRWTFEELGVAQNKMLEIEFEVDYTTGCPATRWDPEEPPEVEFHSPTILFILSDTGEIEANPSWESFLDRVALDLAEQYQVPMEERLWERLGDAEEAAREEYYERKRDEMRGC